MIFICNGLDIRRYIAIGGDYILLRTSSKTYVSKSIFNSLDLRNDQKTFMHDKLLYKIQIDAKHYIQ